jgi:hypothetical protein
MTHIAADPPSGGDALAAELRRLVAHADPMPDPWRPVAEESFSWLAIEASQARLSYDSRLTSPLAGPGVAHLAGATPREVRWRTASRGVEVELDIGADKLRVVGRVVPGGHVEVAALWPEGRRAVASDDGGIFRFDDLPRRPLCFVIAGDDPVKTGWVVA